MNTATSTKTGVQSPIGKYFVDAGRITEAQLERALEHKQEQGIKLGQALVSLGFVTESDLAEALRQQGRINCINLRPELVNVQVAMEFGEKRSRQFRAVAISRIAGYTTVAMEDPSDVYAIDAMGRHLDSRILPVFAEPSKIQATIEHVFSRDASRGPLTSVPGSDTPAFDLSQRLGLPTGMETIKLESGAHETSRVRPLERGVTKKLPSSPAVSNDGQSALVLLRNLLQEGFLQGASDVHLESRREDVLVRFRVDGQLFDRTTIEKRWESFLVERLKQIARLDPELWGFPQSGRAQMRYNANLVDLRVTTAPSLYGESVVVRIVDPGKDTFHLDTLGLLPEQQATLRGILAERDGLVLVAAPSGSGKTSTLHAMLRALESRQKKLVTIEHPIEHEIDGATQIRIDPQAGFGYEHALQTVLNQDPDVLLVGELRDGDALSLALNAALAGRLVLSSWHAVGAPDALRRMIDCGAEPFQLADALRGVVAQRLLRRVCEGCKQGARAEAVTLQRLGLSDASGFFEGRGCAFCRDTGFQGRVPVFEVLPASSTVRQAIAQRADMRALREASVSEGMLSMREHAMRLAREGLTTLDEVLTKTPG